MTDCAFFAVEANLKFSQIGICENNSKKWREVSECRMGMLRDFEIIFIIARKQYGNHLTLLHIPMYKNKIKINGKR